MIFELSHCSGVVEGQLDLDGSKSISNRLLIIRALSGADFQIERLSNSNDTVTLHQLLKSDETTLDVGPAGTTFRFLTAYLCTQEKEVVLTGSERMLKRPIGPLVDALRHIGAEITYEGEEGYPPLRIRPSKTLGEQRKVQINASVSSQFISALLMIAPTLENGLEVELVGDLVSPSYLKMTLDLMRSFGIAYKWESNVISVPHSAYQPQDTTVEADWSGASYHYIIAAFAKEAEIELNGLFEASVQGDAAIQKIMTPLGIESQKTDRGFMLRKVDVKDAAFKYDFMSCPDIAQTMAVVCAGLGIHGVFDGVKTLAVKETDRVNALRTELDKLHVDIKPKADLSSFSVHGQVRWLDEIPRFATYHDHRMAMAFAPLGMLNTVQIEDPKVVGKSYQSYWDHWTQLGGTIQLIK